MILKVKDILIFAAKFSKWISLQSQFCVFNSQKSLELTQEKLAVGQGKKEIRNCNLSGYPDYYTTDIDWI